MAPPPTPSPRRQGSASAIERRFITGIVGVFALAFLAVLWVVTTEVTAEYAVTCERDTSQCAVTRWHLVASERFRVPIPAEARAEVRTTPRKNRAAPRVFLELVNTTERRFLIEYEWGDAEGRATGAATRLNAFLAGRGGNVFREVEGSRWSVWGLLTFLVTLTGLAVVAWRRSVGSAPPPR